MTISFVTLTSANIAEFVPLYFRVFNAPPWNDGWASVADVNLRLRAFTSFPAYLGLGLKIGDEPVAFAFGWGEHWVTGPSFLIKEYCVATERQRAGLGRLLCTELLRRLKEQGYAGTYLQTSAASPAEAFYEAMGFRRLDLVIMGRGLQDIA